MGEIHEKAVSDREDVQRVKNKDKGRDASWKAYVNIRNSTLNRVDARSSGGDIILREQ
jgi:hypothetical protein